MATNVNINQLKAYLANDLGIRKLDEKQAQKYDIDADKYQEVDKDENGLDINEILEDRDLYAQFAAMYLEAKEGDKEVDKEKEEEKAAKVQEKSDSKA